MIEERGVIDSHDDPDLLRETDSELLRAGMLSKLLLCIYVTGCGDDSLLLSLHCSVVSQHVPK